MRQYIQSSCGNGGGQPLSLVFDGILPDVPGAEPNSQPEYPSSDDSEKRRSRTPVSVDINVLGGSSSASGNTRVLSSKSPIIQISSESDTVEDAQLVEVPDESEESDPNSDFQTPSTKRSSTPRSKSESRGSQDQKRYDRHRKFQTLWAAKLPWTEGIMSSDGILHMVKCKVCTVVDRKPCIMAPKSDTLFKHDGKRIARKDLPKFKVKAGQQYIATSCKHRKNMKLDVAKPPATVLQQVNHCTSMEARKKRVQFATLFHLFNQGRPMLEYESRVQLYKLINVPDLPCAHWCDNSGWLMAGYMYKQVVLEMKRLIGFAQFLL